MAEKELKQLKKKIRKYSKTHAIHFDIIDYNDFLNKIITINDDITSELTQQIADGIIFLDDSHGLFGDCATNYFRLDDDEVD